MNEYEQEIVRLRIALSKERRKANTDCLTALSNRYSFEENLNWLYDSGQSFGIVMLDAANLHTANKVLGYDGGDALLKRIAESIREDVDASFRLGGDEFAILVPSCSDQKMLDDIVSRIQAKVGVIPLAPGVSFFVAAGPRVIDPTVVSREDAQRLAWGFCNLAKDAIKVAIGDKVVR